jgi:hypothetical protein
MLGADRHSGEFIETSGAKNKEINLKCKAGFRSTPAVYRASAKEFPVQSWITLIK